MKKIVRLSLKILGVIALLLLLAGAGGWWYLNATFLNFEKDYSEQIDLEELTIAGYTFLDRNGNGQLDVYEDSRRATGERVADVLAQMTLDEKIHLLKGSGLASAMGRGNSVIPGAVGTIVPTPRLGIPTLYLSDGPAGLRIEPSRKGEDRTYYATAFPIGTLLSSTWNAQLVQEVGRAMGAEASAYGIDVILGPGANIHRHPLCGRNFEYYSEDPVLTGITGAAMVNGIESQGVGTAVKHFVANNQETNRNFNDVIVSDRAMREIYLKGFEIIVNQSQPWTIMSSYNKVNGVYTSESKELLTDILRGDWQYQGLVMSDWFGGRDAAAMVAAGNDLLQPGTNRQWTALKKAVKTGTLSEASIDTAVQRILRLIFESKKMEGYAYDNNPNLAAHAAITRQSAAEGMVLLKNNGALPIAAGKNVALLGVTSYDFIAGGTGSGDVNEAYTVSLEDGLEHAGYTINAAAKELYETHRAANEAAFEKPEGINAMFNPYQPPVLAYTAEQLDVIATSADLGMVTIGRNSGEGGDRVEQDDFLLTAQEQEMIESACAAFHALDKQVVVVLNVGGVIETASWKTKPDAILLAWQGGQEGGNSAADILGGKINPSGKLPMTFPVKLQDHAANANFPLDGEPINLMGFLKPNNAKTAEEKVKNKDYTNYEEGIYVGYRHFDRSSLEVSYPFGYGLSYTTFEYEPGSVVLQQDTIQLTLTVTNTGASPGKEVVQVYVAMPDSEVDRPIRELKAFAKTPLLQPGATTALHLSVPLADLRYWSEENDQWELETGMYELQVGASSLDLLFSERIIVRQ